MQKVTGRSHVAGTDEYGATVLGIDGSKNSHTAMKWAYDHIFAKGKENVCILVHVLPKPENSPVEVPGEGRLATKEEGQKIFLPYRVFCKKHGIHAKEIILQDNEVGCALVYYVTQKKSGKLIVGASERNVLMRKLKNPDVPSILMKTAPGSCAIFVISSQGKVLHYKASSQTQTAVTITPPSSTRTSRVSMPLSSATFKPNASWGHYSFSDSEKSPYTSRAGYNNTSWRSESSNGSCQNSPYHSPMVLNHRHKTSQKPAIPINSMDSVNLMDGRSSDQFYSYSASTMSSYNGYSVPQTNLSMSMYSENLPFLTASMDPESSNAQCLNDLDAEMGRLKLQLEQSLQFYNSVERETILAKKKGSEVQWPRRLNASSSETGTSRDAITQMATKLAEVEALTRKNAEGVHWPQQLDAYSSETGTSGDAITQMATRLAKMEAWTQKNAEGVNWPQRLDASSSETGTLGDAMTQKPTKLAERNNTEARVGYKEKVAKNTPTLDNFEFKRYNIEEIEAATDDFSSSHKIGEGGYGPVYIGTLDGNTVAIKILRPDFSEGFKQFLQEVDVLSTMRHPHMVLLLGACNENGCLVYEYMDNGSLDSRLFKENNTPPVPWRTRFRIAAEIGEGLLFLHGTKPEPLVHRDLKPANILLDSNYNSKISDVGLAKLVPENVADSISGYYLTAAAGTFCYIDPEYQQTGKLGTKSDLYSLGVILLQLITGRSPVGLSHQVQKAINKGTFANILDPDIKDWPVKAALSLAKMALKCCELRKRDRPDLATVIMPELDRLRDLAAE